MISIFCSHIWFIVGERVGIPTQNYQHKITNTKSKIFLKNTKRKFFDSQFWKIRNHKIKILFIIKNQYWKAVGERVEISAQNNQHKITSTKLPTQNPILKTVLKNVKLCWKMCWNTELLYYWLQSLSQDVLYVYSLCGPERISI